MSEPDEIVQQLGVRWGCEILLCLEKYYVSDAFLKFSVNIVLVCFEELRALLGLLLEKESGKGIHFAC